MAPRESSAAPASRPDDTGAARPRASSVVSGTMVALLIAATIALGAFAGLQYTSYAAAHLRARPKIPRCVILARVGLRKPEIVSGTEPRQTASGETVYLTPKADQAVGCAYQVDEPFSRHLAGALAEHEPERRAIELVKLLRDHIPRDVAHDRAAYAGYVMAAAAMRAMPADLPEIRAASEEIELLHACRFDTRVACPTRPSIPALVWAAGVPATAGVAALAWLGGSAAASGLSGWSRRRKARKQAAAPEATGEADAKKKKAQGGAKKKKKKAQGDAGEPAPPGA